MTSDVSEETTGAQVELLSAGEFPLWNPDNDFRKLALDVAYVSEGFRLIDKEDLIGVPFVVKRVVYREGFPRNGAEADYISVECIVADKATLSSEPVKGMIDGPPKVFGNEGVVFNDSGTGIRRELTRMFHAWELIDVGEQVSEDINQYDKPFQAWASGSGGALNGITADQVGKAGLYLALRGLRRSDYEWHGQDATTFYFA